MFPVLEPDPPAYPGLRPGHWFTASRFRASGGLPVAPIIAPPHSGDTSGLSVGSPPQERVVGRVHLPQITRPFVIQKGQCRNHTPNRHERQTNA